MTVDPYAPDPVKLLNAGVAAANQAAEAIGSYGPSLLRGSLPDWFFATKQRDFLEEIARLQNEIDGIKENGAFL